MTLGATSVVPSNVVLVLMALKRIAMVNVKLVASTAQIAIGTLQLHVMHVTMGLSLSQTSVSLVKLAARLVLDMALEIVLYVPMAIT